MIENSDHIAVPVRGIEAATAFYARVSEVREGTLADNRKVNLQTLGQKTRKHADIGSGDLCVIDRRSPDQVAQHLLDEGAEIIEGRLRNPVPLARSHLSISTTPTAT